MGNKIDQPPGKFLLFYLSKSNIATLVRFSLLYSPSHIVLVCKISNEKFISLRFYRKSNKNLQFSAVPKLINQNKKNNNIFMKEKSFSILIFCWISFHMRTFIQTIGNRFNQFFSYVFPNIVPFEL